MATRRIALLLGAIAVGLALGVGLDVLRKGGLQAWLASRGPVLAGGPSYEARGRLIEVDGREVYLDCRGAGSPTVVLEAGFGSNAGSWGEVLDGIAGVTRTCAWDRPGLGRSEPRGRHSAGEAVADLRAALAGAGEQGPFVVVAHSLGGMYARLFAEGAPAGAPDAVLGFVMLDTYDPDLGLVDDPALDADVRAAIAQGLQDTARAIEHGEDVDWPATLAELDAAGAVDLPSTILTLDPRTRFTDPDPVRQQAMLDAWYRAVERLNPGGDLEFVENAGHMIHLDRPALVVERTREMVLRFR